MVVGCSSIWQLESQVPSVLASRQTVPCPLLLMHGDKDKLTSPTATMQFASHIKGDVKLKIWEGFYHELHNEPEKLEVLEYAHQWILEKI